MSTNLLTKIFAMKSLRMHSALVVVISLVIFSVFSCLFFCCCLFAATLLFHYFLWLLVCFCAATQFDCLAAICQFLYATLAAHKRLTMSNCSTNFFVASTAHHTQSNDATIARYDWPVELRVSIKAVFAAFGRGDGRCWHSDGDGDVDGDCVDCGVLSVNLCGEFLCAQFDFFGGNRLK